MINKSRVQKFVTTFSGGAVIFSGLLLLGMIVWNASKFAGEDVARSVTVSFGPLGLVEIAKTEVEGGFAASITYLTGLMYYFSFACIFGALVGLSLSLKTKTRNS